MAPPLSPTVKERVALYLQQGLHARSIAAIEGIGISSVYKVKNALQICGQTSLPPSLHKVNGRPVAINTAARGSLRVFLESKPWAYQSEMQDYLLDTHGFLVDQSTVSRTLKAMKISQKSLRRVAAERDTDLRCAYMVQLAELQAEQLIFLDESAANEHTCWRKRGWSPLGIKATVKKSLKRSERYSILPAYCVDGILTSYVTQGSIDSEKFEWFLEYMVLPSCSRYPGPKSVIIMDNCATHHTPAVSILCEAFGVRLLYLPPYSPDFNPIEEFFSVLKAWMKKYYELADSMDFQSFLELAVHSNKGGRDAKNHFRHSCIEV